MTVQKTTDKASGWQSIKTAPIDTLVILYDGHQVREGGYNPSFRRWYLTCDDQWCIEPTHWMPLPEPPK